MQIFPRQFTITDLPLNIIAEDSRIIEWKDFRLIFYEPDAHLLITSGNFVFFGEIFSHEDSDLDCHGIISKLDFNQDLDHLLTAISKWSGYFTLLFYHQGEFYLVNDAAGQYECFYYCSGGHFVISNQPHHITALVGQNEVSFRNRLPDYIKNDRGNIFSYSIYSDILKLVPNHLWKLHDERQQRFYPTLKNAERDFHEVAKIAAAILKGTLLSISKRHKIALGVTAGWDSRVLLAACHDMIDEISLYTLKSNNEASRTDVLIAERIAGWIGKLLLLIDTGKPGNRPQLAEASFYNDTDVHRSSTLADRETLMDFCLINGNVSEIARNFYQPLPAGLSAKDLAHLSKFNLSDFEVEKFEEWLRNFEHVKDLGYDVPDFLYWEHKMPNWAGRRRSTSNLYQLTLSPFNNRELIGLLLSVNKKYRDKDDNRLYFQIIENLWPGLNQFPVNPSRSHRMVRLAKRAGTYKLYRTLMLKLRRL